MYYSRGLKLLGPGPFLVLYKLFCLIGTFTALQTLHSWNVSHVIQYSNSAADPAAAPSKRLRQFVIVVSLLGLLIFIKSKTAARLVGE